MGVQDKLKEATNSVRRNISPFDLAAFLTALASLVLIVPTAQVLAENSTFFTAHGTAPLLVAMILLIVLAIAAIALWLTFTLIQRVASARGYDLTASIITGAVTWALATMVAVRLIGDTEITQATWIFGALIGLAVATLLVLITRQASLGKVLLVVAAVVTVFPLALLQWQDTDSQSGVTVSTADNAPSPPVLLVIADELSYGAVQDENGNVRPQYPNLKSLQMQSTTYTQAYATANATHLAVPSMLTGVADVRDLPGLPPSLFKSGGPFTWLQPRYQTAIISHVISEQDQAAGLSVLPTGGGSAAPDSALGSLGVLGADLAAVIGQTTLPAPLTNGIPAIDDRWYDFWNLTPPESPTADLPQLIEVLTDGEKPGIALWHTMLTHTPYQRDFDGNWWDVVDLGNTDDGLATQALIPLHKKMYAASIREFDRQLGALLDALKAAGTYDETLVIVTSDHGRAFTTQSPWRVGDSRDQRWGDVAHVPLFVKEPGQQTPNFVSAPRTLAQVGTTILQQTGTNVDGPHTQVAPLSDSGDVIPGFWFDLRTGEAGYEFLEPYSWPDPWQSTDLEPTHPTSQFAGNEVASLIGLPVPGNYQRAGELITQRGQGPSALQPLVVEVPKESCPSTQDPGLITADGVVIGSIVWDDQQTGNVSGWSVSPVAADGQLETHCRLA